MKKVILLFILTMSTVFSLEIKSIDPLDFGRVVAGDRAVSLSGVRVYVEGEPLKKVMIEVPNKYRLDGNEMTVKVEERVITLDNQGRGKFKLNVDLRLKNTREYKAISDQLYVKVKYLD